MRHAEDGETRGETDRRTARHGDKLADIETDRLAHKEADKQTKTKEELPDTETDWRTRQWQTKETDRLAHRKTDLKNMETDRLANRATDKLHELTHPPHTHTLSVLQTICLIFEVTNLLCRGSINQQSAFLSHPLLSIV